MKRLIVVTKDFPYNLNEAFLETELKFLQQGFDSVIFFPLRKGIIRSNCSNCVINNSYADLYTKRKSFIIPAVFNIVFFRSLIENRGIIFNKYSIKTLVIQQIHRIILKNVIKKNAELFDANTIVYCYWFDSPVYAWLKNKEDKRMSYKIICRAHRYDVYDEKGDMPNRKYCISNIDKICPISQDAINYFVNKYGDVEKFKLCRLGVKDYGIIAKSSAKGEFRIISISQVTQRKRVDLILESIQAFASRYPQLKVYWTHFGVGDMFSSLRKQVINILNPNLTISLKGYVPNIKIMEYYKTEPIDLFINLSTSEGVPVSVMEAQSFGIPVIATDAGGTHEILSQSNGILLPTNTSVSKVSYAIEQMYQGKFDKNEIKAQWGKISNADNNFLHFVEYIKSLL